MASFSHNIGSIVGFILSLLFFLNLFFLDLDFSGITDNNSNVEKVVPLKEKQELSANEKIDQEQQVTKSVSKQEQQNNFSNNEEVTDEIKQLQEKKLKIEKMIASLKEKREEKVVPLKEKYLKMYNQEHPEVAREIEKIGYQNYEEFLRNCENNFMEVCSKLDHVAKLSYYMDKLDEKREEIRIKISNLKENRWDLERRIELSQVFSNDELENIENLLKDTRNLINSQISVPEKQDIASIEKDILENILSNRVK